MTPTEDLLARLLAEEASAIAPESLRPLAGASDGGQRRAEGLYWFARRRLRPLASVAAALSVLLVIGLLVVARGAITGASPFANVGTAMTSPRYYVEVDPNDNVVVQSTATGDRTDLVTPPSGSYANSTGQARAWRSQSRLGGSDWIDDPAWLTGGTLRFLVARCGGMRVPPTTPAARTLGRPARSGRCMFPRDPRHLALVGRWSGCQG